MDKYYASIGNTRTASKMHLKGNGWWWPQARIESANDMLLRCFSTSGLTRHDSTLLHLFLLLENFEWTVLH